jgi:thiamine-monophosphate kinase
MKITRVGEFGLIDRLAERVTSSADKHWTSARQLKIGIGDDAAVWNPQNSFHIVTVDSLVEGVHFSFKTITWQELGWKSIAVNLSDIAAMGGIPLYALISLGLPPDTSIEDVQALYDGMIAITRKFEVTIAGGDTVSSPFVFISVTIIGYASNEAGKVLTRSAARPGDKIAVTNTLGASTAGLTMLNHSLKFTPKATRELRRAHLEPYPRVAEGQKLLAQGVKACMDISDGLVGDLTHICEASRVGACLNIDLVPVSPVARKCFSEKAMEFALNGGEDYELLFTAPARVIQRVKKDFIYPVTVIGEITRENPGKVMLIDKAGSPVDLRRKGWDAFKK